MEEAGHREHDDCSSEELFLIAHKVRGAPAFDVAIKMCCPLCQVEEDPIYKHMLQPPGTFPPEECETCKGEGFWWIVPTSGHRAYPYWHVALSQVLFCSSRAPSPIHLMPFDLTPPEGLPDHWRSNPATSRPPIDITGLIIAPAPVKIQRRF